MSSDQAPPPAIDETDDMFAGMKKKKKSKKTVNFDAEPEAEPSAETVVETPTAVAMEIDTPSPAAETAPSTTDDLDFSDMKKKKKSSKKSVRISEEEPVADAPAENDDDEDDGPTTRTIIDKLGNEQIVLITPEEKAAMKAEKAALKAAEGADEFGDMMKKKKKKGGKKSTFDLEAFEKELADADAASASVDAVGSSKDATPMGTDGEEGGDGEDEFDDGGEAEGEDPFGDNAAGEDVVQSKSIKAAKERAWLKEGEQERDYTYLELAGLFYMKLYEAHPSLSGGAIKKKYKLAPPSLHRDGTKRSIFANVAEICKQMHREPEHVIQFLFAELGTTGSVDGSARLVIKGRFQQKQIETVLRRYIMAYVTCSSCKSGNTLLTKDNRITYITCESCKSVKSVKAINSGFQAQTGKRRAMRAAA